MIKLKKKNLILTLTLFAGNLNATLLKDSILPCFLNVGILSLDSWVVNTLEADYFLRLKYIPRRQLKSFWRVNITRKSHF